MEMPPSFVSGHFGGVMDNSFSANLKVMPPIAIISQGNKDGIYTLP